MSKIIALSRIDAPRVEALLDEAFGADRKSRTAYRLRAGVSEITDLSFACVEGDVLLGTIQCWPVALAADEGRFPMVLVGPVAVSPHAQGGGIGKRLVTASLEASELECLDALVMIGDPEYYGRFFRFTADATAGWDVPGPVERHRLLARLSNGRTLPKAGRLEALG